jgi:hypothetical protein
VKHLHPVFVLFYTFHLWEIPSADSAEQIAAGIPRPAFSTHRREIERAGFRRPGRSKHPLRMHQRRPSVPVLQNLFGRASEKKPHAFAENHCLLSKLFDHIQECVIFR